MNAILKECRESLEEMLGSQLKNLTVKRAVLGLFFSGVQLSTGQGGLCFTPVKMMPEAVCCPSSARLMPEPGKLQGRTVLNYLNDLDSPSILKKTLAIACINALSNLCFEQGLLSLKKATTADAFDIPELIQGKKAVVVGALVPILKRLKKLGVDYTVLEQDPRTLKGEELAHFVEAKYFRKVVPEADYLMITGTTLINDTLEDLLSCARPETQIVVAGPTLSLITEPFRKRGVKILGADRVLQSDEALDLLTQGASGYHLFGKSVERISLLLN